MEDKIEKIAIVAAQVLRRPLSTVKITYFAGTKQWMLQVDEGAFRVDNNPYYADSLEDLEQALTVFKNGL